MAEKRGEVAGAAQLILVPGTDLLHPEEGVFEGMLSGWTAQMRSRLLAKTLIASRIRPFHGDGPALWPTERAARVVVEHVNHRFIDYRDALGLPDELHPHCLRHSYVTHLIEDGFDPFFVQQQVGHQWGSTTALYTGVSSDYKNRVLRRALDANLRDRLQQGRDSVTKTKKIGYRWHLRQLMAQKDMFSTTELQPLLERRGIHLSPAQVYRLVTQTPERLNLNTLAALCDILDCSPNELIEPTVTEQRAKRAVAKTSGAKRARGITPKRARVTKR